jgi:hypothetical protein
MLNKAYETESFTLRSAGPVPVDGKFIVQTFGVDKVKTKTYEATTRLLKSEDMAGQPGGEHTSASYQRLPYLTTWGEQVFGGTEIEKPIFEDNHELER